MRIPHTVFPDTRDIRRRLTEKRSLRSDLVPNTEKAFCLLLIKLKMGNLEVGRAGEDFACRYLCSRGYVIVERNYRSGHLETDIICENETHILFVEVKSRIETGKTSRFGRPGNACDFKKRQNLRRCAEDYLRKHEIGKKPRIDVIEVYLRRVSGVCVLADKGLHHIENAFL